MDLIVRQVFPYLIFSSIVCNQVLANFGISYIYVGLILLSIGFMLINIRITRSNIKEFFVQFSIPLAYIMALTVLLYLHLMVYGNYTVSIKAYFMYLLYIMYWIIYLQRYSLKELKAHISKTIPIIYGVAILGCIQFFMSPDLFGLLSNSTSNNIQWARNQEFLQYVLFFRASSILDSPQVYSLFMALHILLAINYPIFKRKWMNYAGICFLVVAGSLSGSKSLVLTLVCYAGYKIFTKTKKIDVRYLFLSIIIFASLIFVFKDTEQLSRMININEIVTQEKKDSRLDRYKTILVESNVIIGDGLGEKSFVKETKNKVAESYIFQILSETGLIVTFLFVMMIAFSWVLAPASLFSDIRIFIFSVLLSLVYVHAFASPVFFTVWGVLLASFKHKSYEHTY